MPYTLRQASNSLKPFRGCVFHGTALLELSIVPPAELRARAKRMREAFREYEADLAYCGER